MSQDSKGKARNEGQKFRSRIGMPRGDRGNWQVVIRLFIYVVAVVAVAVVVVVVVVVVGVVLFIMLNNLVQCLNFSRYFLIQNTALHGFFTVESILFSVVLNG